MIAFLYSMGSWTATEGRAAERIRIEDRGNDADCMLAADAAVVLHEHLPEMQLI
jgi:hypothetical protein